MWLHTKEIFGKFAFRYFFPLEEGLTTGRWPRDSTSWGHQFTRPSWKALLFSTEPLGRPTVTEKHGQKLALNSVSSPAPQGLCHTRCNVTSSKLIFRNAWIRMTLTSHSTEEKWSLSWICLFWVFSPFSLEHCPKIPVLPFSCLFLRPLCSTVGPNSDKSANLWYW